MLYFYQSLIHYAGESISQSKNKLNEDAQIHTLRTLIMQCTKCLCNCTKVKFIKDFKFLSSLMRSGN